MKQRQNTMKFLCLKSDCAMREFHTHLTLIWAVGGLLIQMMKKTVCSAIEHNGSYGREADKIKIMGLLTDEESKYDSVVGGLSAQEVFERIKKHYESGGQQ